MPTCPSGKIKRKSYNAMRKGKGIHVKSACIKATSASGKKRSIQDKKSLKKKQSINRMMEQKYGTPICKKGEIVRSGYIKKKHSRKSYSRKDGSKVKSASIKRTEVPPTCIKDLGTKGKGYKIPTVLEKGVLQKYGYDRIDTLNVQQRHSALSRAVKHIPPLSLYRKLVILGTLNKNKDPELAKKFRKDADWVKQNFGLLRSQSKK